MCYIRGVEKRGTAYATGISTSPESICSKQQVLRTKISVSVSFRFFVVDFMPQNQNCNIHVSTFAGYRTDENEFRDMNWLRQVMETPVKSRTLSYLPQVTRLLFVGAQRAHTFGSGNRKVVQQNGDFRGIDFMQHGT